VDTPDQSDSTQPEVATPVKNERKQTESSDRWLAAIGYISILCLIPYFVARERKYVLWHGKQGLLLFICEVAGAFFLWMLDSTIGLIPFLGILVVALVQLAFMLLALALSVLGFIRAIAGERLPLPWLGRFATELPDPPVSLG
jgi:uncharacterized membrane protein